MMSTRQQGEKDSSSKMVSVSHSWQDISSSAVVNEWFNVFAETNHLDKSVRHKLNVVIDDLIANIVSYAFSATDNPEVEVKLELSKTTLIITCIDNGKSFNPFEQEKPDTSLSITERDIGGLGIFLCQQLTDDASYQRINDKNIVKLTVNIKSENNN